MKKVTSQYICNECKTIYSKWIGKCDKCNNWNTITEVVNDTSSFSILNNKKNLNTLSATNALSFTDFQSKEEDLTRYISNLKEFDRVCGGGIVPGSVILLGGDPGVGKSTLLLQLIANLSNNYKCTYISGEESTNQLKRRAKRLNLFNINADLAATSSLKDILYTLNNKNIDLLIIDSIQTMYLEGIDSLPGSITQVRGSASEIINFCKSNNTAAILVGHVTREGQIAGPKVLEHMVDAVLHFEGDNTKNFRILRSIKNRFGSCDEIGIFQMSEDGLIEIENPSSLFLNDYKHNISGTAVFAGMEGSRAVLVEVQSLIAPSSFSSPRRSVVGVDLNRLYMLMALLETRYKVPFNYKDVYVNIAGGIKISDPAVDLAVCASLISAIKDIALPENSTFIGEVSLSGQIRNVFNLDKRINECLRLGFKNVFIPKVTSKNRLSNLDKFKSSINLVELDNIYQLIRVITNAN
ncbi:DNA repair protein RadA [Rickettsiales bacterium LUAb2]